MPLANRTRPAAQCARVKPSTPPISPTPHQPPPLPLLSLSAAEISRELSVSMNTLKTHMRHVYAKLGAHGSTQAIEEPPLGAHWSTP